MDVSDLHSDMDTDEERLRELALPFGPDTPIQGYARVESVRGTADPNSQYPYAVFDKPVIRVANDGHTIIDSGHQVIDTAGLAVHTNRYAVVVEPKPGQSRTVSQLDLYPITHAQRDAFMAFRHGLSAELAKTEDPLAYMTLHSTDLTTECTACQFETKTNGTRSTLIQARAATDDIMLYVYTSDLLLKLGMYPQPGEFWMLFPGFALNLTRNAQDQWISTPVFNPERGVLAESEYQEAMVWTAFVIESTSWLDRPVDSLAYNYNNNALVLPAVLWPFWPNNNPLVATDEAIAATYSKWRQEVRDNSRRDPFYKVATLESERFSDLIEDTRSERPVEDQLKLHEIRQQLKQQPLVRTDWYERGERWQIMPVVTTTPDPPCESTPDTEPIFMGRCGFIMGSREKQFGICTRFVQPEDPRAALVELASQMQQLDLVVAHR